MLWVPPTAPARALACATVGPLIGLRRAAETPHAYALRSEGRVPPETARQLHALATALGRAFFGPPPGQAPAGAK